MSPSLASLRRGASSFGRLALALLVFGAMVSVAGVAEAKHVRFAGPHPVHARWGGGYCYLDVPHVHGYAPDHAALYTEAEDGYVFIGDPSPFGYDGERHAFYGHHPVVVVGTRHPVFCYLDGPHYHPFAAPPSPEYTQRGEVTFYVGALPQAYYQERRQRARVFASEYQPYVSYRPSVVVTPPPEWRGEVWVPPPPTPVVSVSLPAPPSVTVSAPVPSVMVAPPPVPRPPRAHVVVGVPQPPSVYVAPPPRVVVGVRGPRPPTPVYVPVPVGYAHGRGKWHHDNGKHRGWGQGGHRGH